MTLFKWFQAVTLAGCHLLEASPNMIIVKPRKIISKPLGAEIHGKSLSASWHRFLDKQRQINFIKEA